MTRRQYSNTATEATLTGGIAAADTSFALTSFAGYPAVPFTATISRGQTDEEVVLVTAVSVSTVSVTRGYDGTTSKSHAAGSSFIHTTIAKDFDEANAHIQLTTGVHGLTGTVVGTTDAQVLTNKTLTSPVLSGPNVTGTATIANASVSGTLSVIGASTLGPVSATSASVTGAVTVTGLTTLAGLTSGATTLSSVTVTGLTTLTGAVTLTGGVTGPVAATGALSGTTVTGTGLVKGAGLESTQALQLAQIATPTGTASKDTVYAKADGGVYVKAGAATTEGRVTVHWGSGVTANIPASGMQAGDTFFCTSAGGGLLLYNGSAWQYAASRVAYRSDVQGTPLTAASYTTSWSPLVLVVPARVHITVAARVSPGSGSAALFAGQVDGVSRTANGVSRADETHAVSGFVDLAAGTHTLAGLVTGFGGTATVNEVYMTVIVGVTE